MKSNFPLSLKRKGHNQCIISVTIYGSETESYESPGTKTSECPKGNGENIDWYNMEKVGQWMCLIILCDLAWRQREVPDE